MILWRCIKNYSMVKRNLFSNRYNPKFRRTNGRFASPEQAMMDKLRERNKYLEYENEMLKRKLKVFQQLVTKRKMVI